MYSSARVINDNSRRMKIPNVESRNNHQALEGSVYYYGASSSSKVVVPRRGGDDILADLTFITLAEEYNLW